MILPVMCVLPVMYCLSTCWQYHTEADEEHGSCWSWCDAGQNARRFTACWCYVVL